MAWGVHQVRGGTGYAGTRYGTASLPRGRAAVENDDTILLVESNTLDIGVDTVVGLAGNRHGLLDHIDGAVLHLVVVGGSVAGMALGGSCDDVGKCVSRI